MSRPLASRFPALLAAGCLLMVPAAAFTEEDAEDAKAEVAGKVEALLAQRDEAVSGKLAALREQYVQGLEKFRLDWVAANRIDDALAALEMKNALEEHSSFQLQPGRRDSLPAELQRVVDAWDSARAVYVEEANTPVREQLASLRTQAVRAGELDAAQELDRQLALLAPKPDDAPMAGSPAGGREAAVPGAEGGVELPPAWDWGSGGTLQLLPDGTAIHSRWRGKQGSWEWTRHRRIALSPPGTSEDSEIRLNRDGSGEVFAPDGRTTTLTPLDEAP